MNTHDFGTHHTHVLANDGTLTKQKEHPWVMMILIFCGSLILGSIPVIYGSMLASSSTQAPTVPHEATLWQ